MKANAVPVIALFEKKMRLEVPLYQRPYVWTEEQQWKPLWEDIERKFEEYLEGRSDIPVHFLGAVVLDQKQTPATHVERRLVIDGQQRLTTLQIFLVAYRDFCRASGAEALADECANYTLNKGMMPDPLVDKYKVWPTQQDRSAFKGVVDSGNPEKLKEAFPLVRQKWAKRPDPRPPIVDCYLFFYARLKDFFEGTENDLPLANEYPLADRLEQGFQALRNALMVVAIDLENGDDPQVIFETLNARGQPLLPADLLRNYIFLRASRNNEVADKLYEDYWSGFDQPYWHEEVRQGRLNRPRSDLFMQHFLASRQTRDIPIGHLYTEYRHWIEKTAPFPNVEEELKILVKNRDYFRSLHEVDLERPYSNLAKLLKIFDIGTAYPLMLLLLDASIPDDSLIEICSIIESYIVRRAVCNLTNKNYNRVFLNLAAAFKNENPTPASVASYLNDRKGESTEWPSDEAFRVSWMERDAYRSLNAPRIVYLLSRLNETFTSSKTEAIQITDALSIEHIMPQGWVQNWPLPNGMKGVDEFELWDRSADDEIANLTRARNQVVHRIGNLTLVRHGLNSALSNAAWPEKKKQIMEHSLLPINLPLQSVEEWNEGMIALRSKSLFERAIKIWPRLG